MDKTNKFMQQGAGGRACEDTGLFARRKPVWFGVCALLGSTIGGTIGKLLTPDKPTSSDWVWILYLVLGVVGGFIVTLLVIYLWNLLRAPYRQRNEARAKLAELLYRDVKLKLMLSQNDKDLSLQICNTGRQPVYCSAKMEYLKYIKSGKREDCIESNYDIPWRIPTHNDKGENNWKTIADGDKATLIIARADGAKRFGDSGENEGAEISLRLITQHGEPIIADFNTIIRFQVQVHACPAFAEPIRRTFKLKIVKNRTHQKDPYWEIIEEVDDNGAGQRTRESSSSTRETKTDQGDS